MKCRPADRVRSLNFFLDQVAESEVIAKECGIPALLRTFPPTGNVRPHLEQLIDFLAECPIGLLEELVELKQTGNWTPFRDYMRALRARERALAAGEYMREVLADDATALRAEEHAAA